MQTACTIHRYQNKAFWKHIESLPRLEDGMIVPVFWSLFSGPCFLVPVFFQPNMRIISSTMATTKPGLCIQHWQTLTAVLLHTMPRCVTLEEDAEVWLIMVHPCEYTAQQHAKRTLAGRTRQTCSASRRAVRALVPAPHALLI